MSIDEKYSCTSELGAEILMVATSLIIAICVLTLVQCMRSPFKTIVEPVISLFLSLAYPLFLPLMSYLFSQAKQFREGRAQVVLTWMVFIEMIRLHGDPKFSWELRKSAEQLVRAFWISYLIYSYTSLNGIRVSLFILCVYFAISEILKGIYYNKSKNSYLIGKNPELIHNYVKKKMLKNDFHTTPMNKCDYIVTGEGNHEVDIDDSGYLVGKKKSESVEMLTIGRVFQHKSHDEEFTSVHPYWRDTCLSFALAKMLRRRFAKQPKLPVDEAESSKALDFVLEWLNIYMDGGSGERSPTKRVFNIIENELHLVSQLLHSQKPITYYYRDDFNYYEFVKNCGFLMFVGSGFYLINTICKRSSEWMSQLVVQDAYNHCFLVMKTFSHLDQAITILLFIASTYIPMVEADILGNSLWAKLYSVQKYVKDPTKWHEHRLHKNRSNKQPTFLSNRSNNVMQEAVHSSLFDLKALLFLSDLRKWIQRKIARATLTAGSQSTQAKETILRYLRKSKGQLSNGDTSLKVHHMEQQVNRTSRSNWSNTETILIWHIATTLFHYHETASQKSSDSHQEPSPQQNKEREVALELSSYCHKLVAYRPELLPDAVDWTEKIYADVRNEISKMDRSSGQNPINDFFYFILNFFSRHCIPFDGLWPEINRISSGQKPTKERRCSYALEETMDENSIIGKGSKLANDLVNCAKNGAHVWPMLADFWAEMLLFVAPSDNVEAHEEMLQRGELITQLWALLTHAGIISRPKQSKYDNHEITGNNEIAGDNNHEITENNEMAGDDNHEISENNEIGADMIV